eukprot:2340908-Karenia_brevis.AAC.1
MERDYEVLEAQVGVLSRSQQRAADGDQLLNLNKSLQAALSEMAARVLTSTKELVQNLHDTADHNIHK